MFKAIDNWLVEHNFNPIFNKDRAQKPKPQQRKEKVDQVNEEIHLSIAFFEQAINQVGVVINQIDNGIEEAQEEISFHEQEIQEEEILITKLKNRKDRTQRIQQNLESVIAPAKEEDEDEPELGSTEEE